MEEVLLKTENTRNIVGIKYFSDLVLGFLKLQILIIFCYAIGVGQDM
jgi:hypothetical protein